MERAYEEADDVRDLLLLTGGSTQVAPGVSSNPSNDSEILLLRERGLMRRRLCLWAMLSYSAVGEEERVPATETWEIERSWKMREEESTRYRSLHLYLLPPLCVTLSKSESTNGK